MAEDRLSREDGKDDRDGTETGQDCHVDFGVSEEPEEVLPEQRRSTSGREDGVADTQVSGNEEGGTEEAVAKQEDARGQEHGKRQQREDGGYKPVPTGERHGGERHFGRAHIDHGGDDVDRAEQRSDAEDGDAE